MWNIPKEETEKIEDKRKCTDIWALIIMILFFIAVIVLMAVTCILYGDIYRLINGYDSCGNVCGRTNDRVSNIECSGVDMSTKKYLLTIPINESVAKICVESCPAGKFGNRCSGNSTEHAIQTVFQYVIHCVYDYILEFICMCLLAVALSVIMLLLLRYATCVTIWTMLVIGVLALAAISGYLWYQYIAVTETVLFPAIMFTVMFVVAVLAIIFFFKKIKLIIQLFKEAGKAIGAMPCILFEPLLTLIAQVVFQSLFLLFMLIAADSGELGQVTKGGFTFYDYVETPLVKVTPIISGLSSLWLMAFIIDCQNMVIAGAVVRWYFIRDKSKCRKLICRSFYVLCRYHFGTIAIGSFLVSLFTILKELIIQGAQRLAGYQTNTFVQILECVLQKLEELVKYIARNTYIVTAIYGWTFFKSAKRVFHVIKNNFFAIIAINTIGDYVLWFAKIFIVVLTLIPSVFLFKITSSKIDGIFPFLLVLLFALAFAHMFMSVYEMTIDTIFVCFCEDYEENNGTTSPYYMAPEFLQFIENSHKQVWTLPPKQQNQQQSS